jgi:hypothetical protein
MGATGREVACCATRRSEVRINPWCVTRRRRRRCWWCPLMRTQCEEWCESPSDCGRCDDSSMTPPPVHSSRIPHPWKQKSYVNKVQQKIGDESHKKLRKRARRVAPVPPFDLQHWQRQVAATHRYRSRYARLGKSRGSGDHQNWQYACFEKSTQPPTAVSERRLAFHDH